MSSCIIDIYSGYINEFSNVMEVMVENSALRGERNPDKFIKFS